jgi:hypothetical protein
VQAKHRRWIIHHIQTHVLSGRDSARDVELSINTPLLAIMANVLQTVYIVADLMHVVKLT